MSRVNKAISPCIHSPQNASSRQSEIREEVYLGASNSGLDMGEGETSDHRDPALENKQKGKDHSGQIPQQQYSSDPARPLARRKISHQTR